MRHVFLLLMALAAASAHAADWLAAQRWQQRLVIVQGHDAESMADAVALHAAGLEERRMALWLLESDRLLWIGGARPACPASIEGPALDTLREALRHAPAAEGLHLFGLDGGLKASRQQPSQLDELIEAVDSMPMRVRELHR